MRKKQVADAGMIVGFVLLIAILIVLFIAKDKEEISYDENRALARFPQVSSRTLWDGKAYEGMEDYLTDHIPFRKHFLALHAATELAMGKRESNGVIATDNDGLVKRAEYHNLNGIEEKLSEVSKIINMAQEKGISSYAMILPQKIDLYGNTVGMKEDEAMSAKVRNYINDCLIEQIDIYEELCEKIEQDQQVWFDTDHHWTSHGAYLGYAAFLREIGMKPYAISEFQEETVSQSFYGTQYSASGIFWHTSDTLSLLRWQGDENIVVKNAEWKNGDRGLYDMDALQEKDQYAVFLGGNFAHLTVVDPTRESLPKLLLIKDSFANAVVPLLARHFQLEIYDPRYMKASLADVIHSSNASYMLILCGIDTFLSQ